MQLTQLGLAKPKEKNGQGLAVWLGICLILVAGLTERAAFSFFFLEKNHNTFFEVLLHFPKSGQDSQTWSLNQRFPE